MLRISLALLRELSDSQEKQQESLHGLASTLDQALSLRQLQGLKVFISKNYHFSKIFSKSSLSVGLETALAWS